jgi:eukaryotic-like serine/threonine-protein kinase
MGNSGEGAGPWPIGAGEREGSGPATAPGTLLAEATTLPSPSQAAAPAPRAEDGPPATAPWGPAAGTGAPAGEPWLGETVDASPPSCRSAIGRQVGPYTLVERLGRGSQGEVWRAIQLEPFRRVVALKVLGRELGLDAERVDRLRKEAERGGRLAHPAILPVLDFGQDDGHAYVAMPVVDGFTLAEIIAQRRARRDGKLPTDLHRLAVLPGADYLDALAEAIEQVARGLQEAHARQVIHRDVKPSNILLDRAHEGRAFLSDFGLARDLDDQSYLHPGTQPGTPLYMPPERLLGWEGIDEARCDTYALGVTLFEAATLDRPFTVPRDLHRSGWASYLSQAVPRRPRAIEPGLPRDLEAIILKAMDRNPSLRYASASDLADDLARFRARQPVLARPPGPLRRLFRWLGRFRITLSVLGLIMLIGATIVAVRGIDAAITSRRAVALLREADRRYQTGQLAEAAELAIRAHEAAPGHPRVAAFIRRVAGDVSREAIGTASYIHAERARQWSSLWLRLAPLDPEARRLHDLSIGLKTIPLASDPPGAFVTFHAVGPDGRPRPGLPLYEGWAGSPDRPAPLADVAAGSYWVTAVVPKTDLFVERPLTVSPAATPRPLRLRPRGRREATAGMVWVPGGTFRMGSDERPKSRSYPSHPVAVDGFYLDPTEVTNREFDRHLAETGQERVNKVVWPGSGRPDPDRLDWPVTNVTHRQAVEYAAWRGGRLPTEEELEWAARGPKGRLAPEGVPKGWDPKQPAWMRLRAVGSEPLDRTEVAPGGRVFDLYGNAGELTLFRYRPYPRGRAAPPPDDGATPDRSELNGYIVRSGLDQDTNQDRSVPLGYLVRAVQLAGAVNRLVGFRCARSVEPWSNRRPSPSTP